MIDWITPLITAALGILAGGWLTHFFWLKRDREERRREKIISHLIDAYLRLENAANRRSMTKEHQDSLEASISAIFLFGSKKAAQEARLFAKEMTNGSASLDMLLSTMRDELRKELGLENDRTSPVHLRFYMNEEAKP